MKAPALAASLLVAATLAASLLATGTLVDDVTAPSLGIGCKCFPGDACWPSSRDWSSLNQTVGGRLIATVPLAQACHDPNYNPVRCQALRDGWQNPATHMDDSASVMAPFFANQSCDPFTSQSKPCTLGNYVAYAVEVESAADVAATIKFAKNNNIRFVIRNTGHDYNGRSTGAGALSVWTHRMKNIEFKGWEDKYYKGSAVKVGAGVQGFDVMSAGLAEKQVVVGGECPTVGLAGGYTQGGGHSALSTSFGLSADNTLEFEVVTAAGELVTASRTKNTALYWALSGGGGGNYGVVVSMTVKTFPDATVGGATLSFYANENPTETFYDAIDAFHAALPGMVDAGAMVVYYFTSSFFMIAPLTAYNKTTAEVEAIMSPLLTKLTSMGVKHTSTYIQAATYYDHYNQYFGPLPVGNIQVGIAQYGGRLVPLSAFENNATAMSSVTRYIAEKGVTWIGVGTDVSPFGKAKANAVLPAWRTPLVHATLTTEWSFDPAKWEAMLDNQRLMTYDIMPALEAVTPGSGAYMNEADFQQPGFQEAFFGSNYKSLLCVKRQYDPEGFFYARNAVGSERWTVANDGRMCRVL
ncbi:putative isoamyl alcohol oxidase [Chaetomidium leptoderma]|uniref:Isoamyl alcohol oxidase n=1 Tax=Chaetomidium leptoderma TaxID=669021 RepID=A0AAN6ZZ92_9PEZI|nr:putative isoamyl alcohol oxidase [Chaetomidium leptoderma]